MAPMAIRVGINGFGRMGRLVLRAGWGVPGIEFVHVNEIQGGVECAAHLLEFDTVHGRWNREVVASATGFSIGDSEISFSEERDPVKVDWKSRGVDVVLECSGKFKTLETLAPVLEAGVKKIMVAAPVKSEGVLNLVYGVNHDLYRPDQHHILTAASCTTNCLAPVVKVIHEALGIERGSITTIHDVTNTQVMVDAPHKDLRRARSALNSLIPTTTGSATAITMIYPELKGKLNGHAVRVPLLNASLTDCVFELQRKTTVEEVNQLFRAAAKGSLKGVLGFEERPLVSADFVNDPRSSIIDGPSTMVVDGQHLKVYAWYDNEWGYVNRMVDLLRLIGQDL
ncbi:ArsJ-associated glyceraldehyde-3-phosphate dehydrogenase [Kiloniella laminariae]|uniref:Glyceraldehyde-3-phosphate dehydrogenase n=2 Tax=Kiloniella laminariae TaxID=454162 RepID=A0ABT4LMD2_9PROT|nr:ArsJ-associated glyceraldehyde-3-phosphate dehydrogenase [Kiloniella laminariae]MCZ4282258.1 ArsJ-associated glyceraldehyde-3-phosphate dehydrogenase [Kiloniella laminariae]